MNFLANMIRDYLRAREEGRLGDCCYARIVYKECRQYQQNEDQWSVARTGVKRAQMLPSWMHTTRTIILQVFQCHLLKESKWEQKTCSDYPKHNANYCIGNLFSLKIAKKCLKIGKHFWRVTNGRTICLGLEKKRNVFYLYYLSSTPLQINNLVAWCI